MTLTVPAVLYIGAQITSGIFVGLVTGLLVKKIYQYAKSETRRPWK